MTLYELNKAGYLSLPTLNELELYSYQQKVLKFINDKKAKYFMLLNHDIRYFTLFSHINEDIDNKYVAKEVMDIARSLGDIKSIEVSDDENSIEFWIVDYTGECNLYIFFNYDQGVIEI